MRNQCTGPACGCSGIETRRINKTPVSEQHCYQTRTVAVYLESDIGTSNILGRFQLQIYCSKDVSVLCALEF